MKKLFALFLFVFVSYTQSYSTNDYKNTDSIKINNSNKFNFPYPRYKKIDPEENLKTQEEHSNLVSRLFEGYKAPEYKATTPDISRTFKSQEFNPNLNGLYKEKMETEKSKKNRNTFWVFSIGFILISLIILMIYLSRKK